MSKQGKLKKQMSLLDLTLVGIGTIVGSGWLFATSHISSIAGPAGWVSWLIGGLAVLLIGLVYAELGAAIPRSGGVMRYPAYSHGPLVGFLMGVPTLISYTSIISIEVVAVRQYASAWLPALSQPGSEQPTLLGWMVQLALLLAFFLLNYWSVNVFAKTNTVMTIIKFVVPTITIIVLLFHFNPENYTAHGFAPYGLSGIVTAVSTGGVIFAYLGLQPIVSFASEAKNPQRTVPIALFLTIIFSGILYIMLQISFQGSIPPGMLSEGWGKVAEKFTLPYQELAVLLGLGWLATIISIDAVISPSGTGNVYMASSSRMIFGWSRTGTLFKVFTSIDRKSGIPRPALWFTLALSIFWTLPFPSWSTLVGLVSSALVLSYALAPISAHAFRKNAKDLSRPFYLKGLNIISPLAFVISSLIVYWTGWSINSWLLGILLVMFVVYTLFKNSVPTKEISFAQQLKSSWWLVFYFAAMLIASYLGTFGNASNIITNPWDQIMVTIISLVSYYWGVGTCLPKAIFDKDEEEETEFIKGSKII